MPTGACGINCDVCKLRLLGVCSSCGSGKSIQAEIKLAAQKRIFSGSCAILECAVMNHREYCLRDCNMFPCENFTIGPYPFSQGFLNMQDRRRRELPPARSPDGTAVQVPEEYWDALCERDLQRVSNLTLFEIYPPDNLVFMFLNEPLLVDRAGRCLQKRIGHQWRKIENPMLELLVLLYLKEVKQMYPIGKDIVGYKDLKCANFFQAPHELKTTPLVERYGNDAPGFEAAAKYLHGIPVDMADIAYQLSPFPRIPLYYLFWKGDAEFRPKINILFDRAIEEYFSGSGIWGLVNLVTTRLLVGPPSGL